MILGGAVAGQGDTSIVLTIGIVWVAAFAGDTTSFMLGRRLGREFILRHGPKVRITHERFAKVEDYFARHGGKTILIGRFIGLVRALAPFTAGSSGMRYSYYAPFSIIGTGLWAAAFSLIGYFASQSLDAAASAAGEGTLLFGIAVAVIVAIVVAVRFLREADNRARLVAEMERRPILRPLVALGRRLAPEARFVIGRLTPGGLGLEFTTLVAVLAVALYVVIAYTTLISHDPGPDSRGSNRGRSRRRPSQTRADLDRQGRHRPRIGRDHPAADPGRDGLPRRCGDAGARRWCFSPRPRSSTAASRSSATSRPGRARRAGWWTSRATAFRAGTRLTR